MQSAKRVIIYDGKCGLCSRTVRFLQLRDRHRIFTFLPLHDVDYQVSESFRLSGVSNTNTVIYLRQDQIYQYSEAVIRILNDLGGPYKMSLLLLVVPRVIRDSLYSWIAKNRNRWFKQSEACEI